MLEIINNKIKNQKGKEPTPEELCCLLKDWADKFQGVLKFEDNGELNLYKLSKK